MARLRRVVSILTAFSTMSKNTHRKPRPRAAWSGRFAEPVAERVQRYTASVAFDKRLAEHDIRGSLAHARMLAACAVISRRDLAAIESGMRTILAELRSGKFKWSLASEDVHLNIERRLTALAGDAGKRLHTARSRNDQVATDVRLWLRDAIDAIARPAGRAADEPARPGRAPRRHGDARLHPSAGGAAGDLRPSPAGLFRDVRARPRAARRLPQARQPPAAGRGRARRHHLSDRSRDGGEGAGVRRHLRQLAGRGVRPRLRHRVLRRGRAGHDPHLAPVRGTGAVDEPALSASSACPTASAPARPSCRRRRTRTCPNSRAARPAA